MKRMNQFRANSMFLMSFGFGRSDAGNKVVSLISPEGSSPIRLPDVHEINLGMSGASRLPPPIVLPVKVEGEELVIEDGAMEANLGYAVEYHGREYLVRKRDDNTINIYVVKE